MGKKVSIAGSTKENLQYDISKYLLIYLFIYPFIYFLLPLEFEVKKLFLTSTINS